MRIINTTSRNYEFTTPTMVNEEFKNLTSLPTVPYDIQVERRYVRQSNGSITARTFERGREEKCRSINPEESRQISSPRRDAGRNRYPTARNYYYRRDTD
jgi:CRISPR/Cas system endoribonuclease Cas6 (RAMP superfamily)